jgi:putative transposase
VIEQRMKMLERDSAELSIRRQCELLGINRGRLHYKPEPIDMKDVEIMNEIRNIYEEAPFFGYRRVHYSLRRGGYEHNIKKTHRLMRLTGLRAIYPGRETTIVNAQHKKYPYLLRDMKIVRPNQVWQVDITYIKILKGFGYLVCLIDIFTRRIMGWAFSPFLEAQVCLEALENALQQGTADIINSDQGCQFTCRDWIDALTNNNVQISMDGKGRWADNIYVERLWRSIKYEAVYLHSFDDMHTAKNGLAHYINFYNAKRPHQSLNYQTPDEVYFDTINKKLLPLPQQDMYTAKGGELSQV